MMVILMMMMMKHDGAALVPKDAEAVAVRSPSIRQLIWKNKTPLKAGGIGRFITNCYEKNT